MNIYFNNLSLIMENLLGTYLLTFLGGKDLKGG